MYLSIGECTTNINSIVPTINGIKYNGLCKKSAPAIPKQGINIDANTTI